VEAHPEVEWGVEEGFSIIRARDLMMELGVLAVRQRGAKEAIGREVRRREAGEGQKSRRVIGARPTSKSTGNVIW
jgi:hypothetical protein